MSFAPEHHVLRAEHHFRIGTFMYRTGSKLNAITE
jgi:hypothetical protein